MLGKALLGKSILGARSQDGAAPITIASPTTSETIGNEVVVFGQTDQLSGVVEYRIGAGAWSTLATPSGGSYSGQISGLTAGAGQTIEVRQSIATSNTASVVVDVVNNFINITSPVPNRLYGRGLDTTVDISVTFAYVGVHSTGFEVRDKRGGTGTWISYAAGSNPQTVTLRGVPRGVFELEVRSASQPSVIDSVTPVAVGLVIAMMGQSNSSGRGTNNQTAPGSGAYLYDNTGAFRALADPYDGNFGGSATYSVLDDAGSAGGSYAPRIAVGFAAIAEPVMMIPANKGSTSIGQWTPDNDTATLYGASKARITAAGGCDVIVWHQGEANIVAGTTEAAYESALTDLVDSFFADFACPTAIVLLDYDAGGTLTAELAAIRQAQQDVITNNTHAYDGGDIAPFADLHLTADSDFNTMGDKAYAALRLIFPDKTAGPRLYHHMIGA